MKLAAPHFRYMNKPHLNDVVRIESVNSQMASPISGVWTEDDFIYVMRQRNHLGVIAIEPGADRETIVGFAIYNVQPDKIHICNMAVHPERLRQGVGTAILNRLKSKLRPNRRVCLEIDIRETNLNAQLFLKANGFRAISVIRNWYEKPQYEDAYKFQFNLEEPNGLHIHRKEFSDRGIGVRPSGGS